MNHWHDNKEAGKAMDSAALQPATTNTVNATLHQTTAISPSSNNDDKQSDEVQKKPQRRPRMAFSKPYLTRGLVLNSMQTRRVFERELFRALSGLYTIDVVLSVVGDVETSKSVKGVVKSYIAEVSDKMAEEMSRFDLMLEENGAFDEVNYSHPEPVEIKIYSPESNLFINILTKLDALVYKADQLWLCGIMPQENRAAIIFDWQSKIMTLGRRIKNDAQRAYNSAIKGDQKEEVNEALLSKSASIIVGDESKATLADTVKISDDEDKKKDEDVIKKSQKD